MKAPSIALYARQRRLSHWAMKKRRAVGVARRRRARSIAQVAAAKRSGTTRLKIPAILRFHGPTEHRFGFAELVREATSALELGRKVLLDLSGLERIYPCGLLLLMGQVRSWSKRFPGRLSASYPRDNVAEQMLQSVGLLERLGLSPRLATISHDDVTRWHYFTGTEAAAQEMEPFMDELSTLVGASSRSLLYDSVVEAITNVRQHAYGSRERTPWWMFATISPGSVSVAIYDQGASIPATLLEKPGVKEMAAKWFAGRKKLDAWLIQAAVRGRSSTKLPYRGKGLPEMLESTQAVPGSALGIFSREGVFFHDGSPPRSNCLRLDVPILGTLILWNLILPEGEK